MNSYIRILYLLIMKDMRHLRHNIVSTILDSILLPLGFVFIAGYVMPSMGLQSSYGLLMVGAIVMGMVLNSNFIDGNALVADIHGNRALNAEILLPIPSSLLVIRYILTFAFRSMILNFLTIPIGMLIVARSIVWHQVSIGYLLIAYIVTAFTLAALNVAIPLQVKSVDGFNSYWLRVGWQLMNFGGFLFSWYPLWNALPLFAIINLLNPVMLSTEVLRIGMMGPEGFLPQWLTLLALILYTLIFSYWAVIAFKKRLDCY